MKDSPTFKKSNKGTLLAAQYDLRNTTRQLKKLGLLELSPQLATLKTWVDNWSPEIWQGTMTLNVGNDGIKAEGSYITMAIFHVIDAVIITSAF